MTTALATKTPAKTTRIATVSSSSLPPFPFAEKKRAAATLAVSDSGFTRLHITPLDAGLLDVVLPASIRGEARNVSFHSLQSFPERRYGFVDLPEAAAEKLRKKLNGAVLKGVKIQIQPARASREPVAGPAAADTAMPIPQSVPNQLGAANKSRVKNRAKYNNKRDRKSFVDNATMGITAWRQFGKDAPEEIPGVQLEPGRQVKRGWTAGPGGDDGDGGGGDSYNKSNGKPSQEPDAKKAKTAIPRSEVPLTKKERKAAKKERRGKKVLKERYLDAKKKKKQAKSQFTNDQECLIKTILPPKAAAAAAAAAAADERTATTAAIAEGEAGEGGKKKKRSRNVVVHEFEHRTKFPSFLKASAPVAVHGNNLEYTAGKGWVDSHGEVVEPIQPTRPADLGTVKLKAGEMAGEGRARKNEVVAEDDTSESSSSGSDSDSDSDGDSDSEKEKTEEKTEPENVAIQKARVAPDTDESSDSSSSEDSDNEDDGAENEGNGDEDDSDSGDDDSSGSESSSDEEEEDQDNKDDAAATDVSATLPSPRPKSAGSAKGLTIKIPQTPAMPATPVPAPTGKVHPLEALYKRQKTAGQEESAVAGVSDNKTEASSFAFFGPGGGDDDEDDDGAKEAGFGVQQPMTPFTAEDFEWRHTRSAAPTPDTAHPTRTGSFKLWPSGKNEDGDEDENESGKESEREDADRTEEDGDRKSGGGGGEGDKSGKAPTDDFQSWFWDNRGDLNRSWKRRRKTVAKEKRYRDNRARASRAI